MTIFKDKCNRVNGKIYQLGKLSKFVTSDIANLIYKQTILPVLEYADLMVGSGPAERILRLQKLQEKAIRIIDNNAHVNLDVDILSNLYRLTPLKLRRAGHLSLLIFPRSKNQLYLDNVRPTINLRGRHKITFKKYKRQNEKYMPSPLARGLIMWDQIPEQIQSSK